MIRICVHFVDDEKPIRELLSYSIRHETFSVYIVLHVSVSLHDSRYIVGELLRTHEEVASANDLFHQLYDRSPIQSGHARRD